MPTADPLVAFIRLMLDGSFTGRGWQGATLRGAIRGVTAREALWRPGPGRRCIWEHVLHAAYWKHAVARVLDESAAGTFDRSPSNWPAAPGPLDPGLDRRWKSDRAYLADVHRRLTAAAARVRPDDLGARPGGRKWSLATYLAGAAAHDAYHLGQVQLIKRLARQRPAAGGPPATARRRSARQG
jgi:hypothetical protein